MAVVTSGYLPVPNVCGGAVEALDMALARTNERNHHFELTFFSMWTQAAENAARQENLKYSDFKFIKTPWIIRSIDLLIYVVAKYVLRKAKLMSYRYIAQRLWYIHKVAKELSKDREGQQKAFDKVMIENHATLFMILKKYQNNQRYAGNVYYHLHNELTGDFGCKKEISQVRKVLGVSNFIVEALDQFLHEHGEQGLAAQQKAVWRNGTDVSRFGSEESRTQAAKMRERWGLSDEDMVFLFSGRLTAEKGAEQLLTAFKRIASDVPHAKLVIAGAFFFNSEIKSPFEQHLHELASDPLIRDRIVFTGFVDHEDMPAVYALANVCVLPSVWNDPAPLAVIEALAAGKPLITTRSGGIPEYANADCVVMLERDSAFVDNLVNAMRDLASDNETRARIAEKAYKIGHQYDIASYADDLYRLVAD